MNDFLATPAETTDQIDAEILELKNELLRLGALKEELHASNKLRYFVPTKKQMDFFDHAEQPHRAGFCGNRFGKSTLGVVEDCCWLLGERPFFAKDDPRRRAGIPVNGVKGLVIAEDWDKVDEIFTSQESLDRPGKFFEFLPKDKIKGWTKGQKGQINSITVVNEIDGRTRESVVIFDTVRAYLNNPASFESSDWDFIHADEPLPKGLWIAASRGLLDRGGKTWWLLTPLGFPWMYEESVALAAAGKGWYFEASMDDNPTLNADAKERYLASLTTEEREARQFGRPLAYGRRVYGHFDERIHVWPHTRPPHGWKDFFTPPTSYHCGYALDCHPQTPHAVLFAAIAPTGEVFFYDEIFEKLLLAELAKKINFRRDRVPFSWEICDPIAWVENPDTGQCWADTLWQHGLYITRASKQKTAGIMQTQAIFASDFPKKIYVMPHMANFLREIKGYYFDRENKPTDENDHLMECLYRTVVHDGLVYRNPISFAPLGPDKDPCASPSLSSTDLNYNAT